jgi:hypothetical protein
MAYDYYLSMCAMFKNEADILKEWIEFHRIVGIEHFYLFNNDSEDNYLEILDSYIKEGIVTLIEWPSSPEERDKGNWDSRHKRAFDHCVTMSKGVSRWVAFLDIDEFIVPMQHDSLSTLMRNYESYSGLKIYWQDFGTGNVEKIPDGKTMVESLLFRAPQFHPSNGNFKMICNPRHIQCKDVHDVTWIRRSRGSVNAHFNTDANQWGVEIVRLQHYWTRDEGHFLQKKIPRREIYDGRKYTEAEIDEIRSLFNQEFDDSIMRFVPELRKRMGFDQ